jgi:hypothetical protein
MKRIVLAAIACLSLLVALPALSAAHSSSPRLGRDNHPEHRLGEHHRDRHRDGRLEHFAAPSTGTGTAAVVRSFQNGVLTITLADGSTASGMVTPATRVSCETMNGDVNDQDRGGDGGQGNGDNAGNSDNAGHGDNGDNGDNGDRANDPSCVAMLRQPGTAVRDAELQVSQGNAVWQEVELGR